MAHVVVAPDKFKGSLTAAEAAAHLASGLRRAAPGLIVHEIPVADGGEGTVEAALAAGGRERRALVTDPLGRPVEASYALLRDETEGCIAVVEMARASGLAFTDADDRAARCSSSFGTGELLADALDQGATRIVLGVGGSASTDGGAGMLAALGAELLDDGGAHLVRGGDALRRLARVDLAGLDDRLSGVEIVLAADVTNPLLGPEGAAPVYAPQKGADADAVDDLEAGLRAWVEALEDAGLPAASVAAREGAGAAGGVGFAAMLLGARQRPGIEVIIDLTGFADAVEGATLVVTGEGSLDEQSLFGKTPVGVAAAAAHAGVPTVVVAGRSTLTEQVLAEHGIAGSYLLSDLESDPAISIAQAGRLLEDVAGRIVADRIVADREGGVR